MKTVSQHLKYKFTPEQIMELKSVGIINGIGGKGGYDFDKLLNRISKVKQFKKIFENNLHKDIQSLAHEHDFLHWQGNTIKGFLSNNYDFTIGLIGLLHWSSLINRIILFFTVFSGLTFIGWRYYNWNQKRIYIFK